MEEACPASDRCARLHQLSAWWRRGGDRGCGQAKQGETHRRDGDVEVGGHGLPLGLADVPIMSRSGAARGCAPTRSLAGIGACSVPRRWRVGRAWPWPAEGWTGSSVLSPDLRLCAAAMTRTGGASSRQVTKPSRINQQTQNATCSTLRSSSAPGAGRPARGSRLLGSGGGHQGLEEQQPAFLGQQGHGLGRHVQEVGHLGGMEVAGRGSDGLVVVGLPPGIPLSCGGPRCGAGPGMGPSGRPATKEEGGPALVLRVTCCVRYEQDDHGDRRPGPL